MKSCPDQRVWRPLASSRSTTTTTTTTKYPKRACMLVSVISIRIPEETTEVYRRLGLRPSVVAKEYLMQHARELELDGRLQRFAVYRKPSTHPVVDDLRDVRDHD